MNSIVWEGVSTRSQCFKLWETLGGMYLTPLGFARSEGMVLRDDQHRTCGTSTTPAVWVRCLDDGRVHVWCEDDWPDWFQELFDRCDLTVEELIADCQPAWPPPFEEYASHEEFAEAYSFPELDPIHGW